MRTCFFFARSFATHYWRPANHRSTSSSNAMLLFLFEWLCKTQWTLLHNLIKGIASHNHSAVHFGDTFPFFLRSNFNGRVENTEKEARFTLKYTNEKLKCFEWNKILIRISPPKTWKKSLKFSKSQLFSVRSPLFFFSFFSIVSLSVHISHCVSATRD